MKEFADRLKEALKQKGLKKQKDVANILQVSPGYMSELLKGKNLPSERLFSTIEAKLGISSKWLAHGMGEMFLKLPIPEAIQIPRIPVLGRVPAGFPENYEEDVIEYISPPHAAGGTYGLIVKGESMAPNLKDGDYILFVIDGDYKNGDIVVANDEWGASMVKRYRIKSDGEVLLASDNPEHPSFKPNENWQIIGRVVDVWRRIKL